MTDPYPYRVADAQWYGWHQVGTDHPDDPPIYDVYPTPPDVVRLGPYSASWPLWKVAERGPLHLVDAPTTAETATVVDALTAAQTLAVGTVCWLLGDRLKAHHRADGHTRRMVCGRPGSWESEAIKHIGWNVGCDMRTGRRVDQTAVVAVGTVLDRWTCWPPGAYPADAPVVEVAETLACLLGEVADNLGGWDRMADRWLRSASPDVVDQVRGWFIDRSANHHGMPI